MNKDSGNIYCQKLFMKYCGVEWPKIIILIKTNKIYNPNFQKLCKQRITQQLYEI